MIGDITAQNQRFTLVNIYDPNFDNPVFFQNIFQHIEDIGNLDFILCGDFNLIIDSEMDCYNYKNINNPKARDKVLEYIDTYNMIDPFHENCPYLKQYT